MSTIVVVVLKMFLKSLFFILLGSTNNSSENPHECFSFTQSAQQKNLASFYFRLNAKEREKIEQGDRRERVKAIFIKTQFLIIFFRSQIKMS